MVFHNPRLKLPPGLGLKLGLGFGVGLRDRGSEIGRLGLEG